MKYYTDLNIYGHLSLELSSDNSTNGAINNVPTANISFIRFTGASPVVSGFADGGENNKLLIIAHAGTGVLTLKNLNNLSTANNKIITGYGEDITLQPGHNAILIYDSGDYVWRIISVPSTVLTLTGTTNQIEVDPSFGNIFLSLPQDIHTGASPTFNNINLSDAELTSIISDTNLIIQSDENITLTPAAIDGKVTINSDTVSSSAITGALVVGGGVGVSGAINASGTITGSVLSSSQSVGSEGGQIDLALAASNTTLSGNVSIDVYQNRLRIFENGGSNRGVYIDLTATANSVGTNLIQSAASEADTLETVVGRGATSTNAITISNSTEASNRTSGALIVSGGIGVAKRINTLNLTINGVKQRAGVSAELDSAVINLSSDDYLIYYIDQTEVSGFLANISFTNGTAGEIFYVKVKSDGNQYTWDVTNGYIKWPSDIIPSASDSGKTDLYHFICLSATEYLGTYVFNYT
jgi:hypothetical protein